MRLKRMHMTKMNRLCIWAFVSALLAGWLAGRTPSQCLVVAYCFFFPFLFIPNNAVFSLCIYLHFKTASSSINTRYGDLGNHLAR